MMKDTRISRSEALQGAPLHRAPENELGVVCLPPHFALLGGCEETERRLRDTMAAACTRQVFMRLWYYSGKRRRENRIQRSEFRMTTGYGAKREVKTFALWVKDRALRLLPQVVGVQDSDS